MVYSTQFTGLPFGLRSPRTGRTRLIFPFVWNTQISLWVWTRAVPFFGGFLIFLGLNRR